MEYEEHCDAPCAVLEGGLWHATSPGGLAGILIDGEIRVFGRRWSNSLCRMLDGVSLWDFGPTVRHSDNQGKAWRQWYGHRQESRVAVWLEISRSAVGAAVIDACVAREVLGGRPDALFIPGLEACHKGAIPISALVGVVLIDCHNDKNFLRLEVADATPNAVAKFEEGLPAPPPLGELERIVLESMALRQEPEKGAHGEGQT